MLLRLSEEPGELAGYGPIPAEVARQLAADGLWRRWLVDESGRVADVGSLTYTPSAALDRYVRGRDGTCRFPTCTRPAVDCDLDHTIPFDKRDPHAGGSTVAGNLTALCRRHHRLKHESDWSYRTAGDGSVLWTAPSGRQYVQPAEDHAEDAGFSDYY